MIKLDINIKDLLRGIIIAGIFILFSFISFSAFESLERILYGIEMRLALSPSMGASKIAIVNIDEKSLDNLGSWPWPRSVIADMITILKNNGASLIGLDLDFSEKEKNQGLEEIRGLYNEITGKAEQETAEDTWLINRLNEIEQGLDSDNALIHAVKESGNIILPVTGNFGKYDTELVLTDDSVLNKNRMKLTGIQLSQKDFISVNELKTPFPELSLNSHGLGHINLSPDYLIGRALSPPVFRFQGPYHTLHALQAGPGVYGGEV